MIKIEKWFKCPVCGQRLLKYNEKAISKNIYIKCKKCKKEIEIIIKHKEEK